MTRLYVRQNVTDYDAWRAVYDAFHAEHGAAPGETERTVWQSTDDPRDVTVEHIFDSVEHAKALIDSPDLHAAMKQSGVIGTPQIWYAERR